MRATRLLFPIGMIIVAMMSSAAAHDLRMARIDIWERDAGRNYDFLIATHVDSAVWSQPDWPSGCRMRDLSEQVVGDEARFAFRLECDEALDGEAAIRAPWGADGAVVAYHARDGAVAREVYRGGGLELRLGAEEKRNWGRVAAEYLGIGVEHILIGWDHLAFVLCLCLLVGGWRLVELVTAFTVGHSVSLALSFLGLVAVPIAPVEAAIALSIVFMAREGLIARGAAAAGGGGAAAWRLRGVVAAFGLLHGLGFASVLSEIGVARGEIAAGLFAFNLGVEFGQLIFVGAVTLALMSLARFRLRRAAATALLWGAGLAGAFWTIERTAGFV